MKRLSLLLFSFFCFPSLVWAGQQFSFPDLLSPPAIKNGTDSSIHYLQNIFGVVDGVLFGSGSQIMGKMFAVFNAGALILGVAIIVYIIVVGVLQTAAEGETLGRNWSSLWIPFRAVFGIALLVPSGTGYSVIQIFMMWVVVQGVAVADSVWNAALGYLMTGGVIIEQAALPQQNLSEEARSIFKAQVCMAGLQTALQRGKEEADKLQQSSPTLPTRRNINVPLLASSVLPIIDRDCKTDEECKNTNCTTDGKCTVSFPGNLAGLVNADEYASKWKPLEGVCGKVSWSKPYAGGTEQLDLAGKLIARDRSIAVQQMILTLQGPAQNAVQLAFSRPPDLTEALNQAVNANILLNASAAYQGITKAADSYINRTTRAALTYWFKMASDGGWIHAGSYFQDLVRLNLGVQQQTTPPSATFGSSLLKDENALADVLEKIVGSGTSIRSYTAFALSLNTGSAFSMFVDKLKLVESGFAGRSALDVMGNAPITVEGIRAALNAFSILINGAVLLLPPPGQWLPFSMFVTSLAQAAFSLFLMGNQAATVNPILSLSLIGHNLMTSAVGAWAISGIGLTALATGLGAIPFVQLATGVTTAVSWFGVFIFPLLIGTFAEGAVMAFYIPLIPFIIFLFATIGWFISVIEAMAAAPLIALGIAHPEGSPVLGKADPAVLMLVSVFIRPALMIIGFIAGIIISYVGVWLLGRGVWYAFFSNWQAIIVNPLNVGFAISAFMLIYILLAISIMNMAFALIENLHNNVLQWIGGQRVGGGESQSAMGEVKGGFKEGMSSVGRGAEKTAEAGAAVRAGRKGTVGPEGGGPQGPGPLQVGGGP